MKRQLSVFVACEHSQAVCIAFRKLGHVAYSCDLLPCSGGHPEWHFIGDCRQFLRLPWDIVIAHPPCTYLSNAGARYLYPHHILDQRRYNLGLEGWALFFDCLNANAPFVCVENPTPSKVFALPPFSQKIQPYDFGHPYKKGTCLWLRGLPPLMSTSINLYRVPYVSSGRKARIHRPKLRQVRSASDRSLTFPGVASAMAQQWSDFVLGKLK